MRLSLSQVHVRTVHRPGLCRVGVHRRKGEEGIYWLSSPIGQFFPREQSLLRVCRSLVSGMDPAWFICESPQGMSAVPV